MSATSAPVISACPSSGDPFPAPPMALKVEPDIAGAAGGPMRLAGARQDGGGVDAGRSSPATASSDEEQRQQQEQDHQQRQQQLRDCLESHVSEPARSTITRIVEEVETWSEMEKLLLLLRLPNGRPSVEAALSGLPGSAGASNLHLSNQLEQSQAFTWIMSHLEEHPSTCLRKDEVYDDYRSYCENHQMKCLNTADFGKVMKRAFPNVKPRRLGQRGQSKYCYGGMRKRVEVQPPCLPDLNPAADTDRTGTGSGPGSTGSSGSGDAQVPVGETMLPECIVLVLEWVEKLLGRQFETLRQLAEYLVTNMYVNSRSCAAFSLVADIHSQQARAAGRTAGRRTAEVRRRTSVGAREEARTPGESAPIKPLATTFATPPATRTSPRPVLPRSQTPPGPPLTAYSAASVRRRLGSPITPSAVTSDASSVPSSYPGAPPSAPAPPSYAPPVKPNLLQLPSNLKDAFASQQTTPTATQLSASAATTAAYASGGQPMRAFPPYPGPSFGHQQPPAAHSQSPYQRYPVLGETSSSSGSCDTYPPPPLQYGGGAYTPVHRGKRPYEATTQEHYSPYYTPNNAAYPANDYTSPKRQRFASMGESSTEYGAGGGAGGGYYQPQPQPQPPTVNNSYAASSQFTSSHYDPYCYGMSMLSPRASSSHHQHQQPQPQPQPQPQQQQQPQQSQQQQLPRLGCSPGPYAASRSDVTNGAGKVDAAGPSRVLLPSLPKLSRPSSRPRVGRTPSPVRFTAGPPVGPGLRRPSPLRSSPGQPSSHGSCSNGPAAALGSPESSGSIQLRRSPGSPFRSLGGASRKPDEHGVSSTAAEDPVPSSSSSTAALRRSTDLHTPTPPTTCAAEPTPGPYYFHRADQEPSPPSAFL